MQDGGGSVRSTLKAGKAVFVIVLVVMGQAWAIARAGRDVWSGDYWALIPAAGVIVSLFYVAKYGAKALRMVARHEEILTKAAGMIANGVTFLALHNGRNARFAAALETFKLPPDEFEKRVRAGAIRF